MPEYPRSPLKKIGTSIIPKVSGDALDETVIGSTTPAAGSFTTGDFSNIVLVNDIESKNTITLKEITTPAAKADYGKIYTKSDDHFYIQDGAGNERPILLSGQDIAEMYLYQNTTVSVIDTADVWHLLSVTEITPGELDGWTYEDGVRGTDITGYETYDSGASTVVTTIAAHNLSSGDYISITGTTNYNDIYKVLSAPSALTFEINKAWDTNDDGTGTYNRGGTLICGANAGGTYKISWNITVTPQTNGHVFTGVYILNGVVCEKCRSREKLGTAADYSNLGANSLRKAVPGPIAAGDKIQFAFKNIGNTGNFTGRHGNLNMHKV